MRSAVSLTGSRSGSEAPKVRFPLCRWIAERLLRPEGPFSLSSLPFLCEAVGGGLARPATDCEAPLLLLERGAAAKLRRVVFLFVVAFNMRSHICLFISLTTALRSPHKKPPCFIVARLFLARAPFGKPPRSSALCADEHPSTEGKQRRFAKKSYRRQTDGKIK